RQIRFGAEHGVAEGFFARPPRVIDQAGDAVLALAFEDVDDDLGVPCRADDDDEIHRAVRVLQAARGCAAAGGVMPISSSVGAWSNAASMKIRFQISRATSARSTR